MLSVLFKAIPMWVKILISVSLLSATLGGLIHYVDSLFNSEKRELKEKLSHFKKEIQHKNVTIKRLRSEIVITNNKSKNDLLRTKIECAKRQRRHYEIPVVDANSSFWF